MLSRKWMKKHLRNAVKTGIAGGVCLWLTTLLPFREGYWAVISTVIVMQSSIGAAVEATWSRMAGTAIGAFVGMIFTLLWVVDVFSVSLALTTTVLLCALLRLISSYRLAGVTAIIVMLVGRADVPWIVALHRFFEVSLGAVVALLVTVFVWPSRARKNLRRGVGELVTLLHTLYHAGARRYIDGIEEPTDELRAKIGKIVRNNQNLMEQTIYEPRLGPEHKELLMLLVDHSQRVLHAIDALEPAIRESAGDTLSRKFEPELGRMVEVTGEAIRKLADDVRSWNFSGPSGEVAQAISALEARTSEVRRARLTEAHELEEILHFYSFFQSIRNLAREVEAASEAASRWWVPEETQESEFDVQ